MKQPHRLSQAARLAKSKRERTQRRKEREVRFPKPKLVPKKDESSSRADDEQKTSAQILAPVALLSKVSFAISLWPPRSAPNATRTGFDETCRTAESR